MVVLSCFDGMSCGQLAFKDAGIKVSKYYASEIDRYAIKVTQANFPDTIQLGSITEWKSWGIEQPDIIIGGSPCQGFSFAGKGLNFEDERSKLFFTFIEILTHYKPKYFLLENVIMKKEHNDVISSILGEMYPECVEYPELFRTGRLEPIEINSALVSAQNRRRLYWTNIPGITQPKDQGILLRDIIEEATTDKDKSFPITASYVHAGNVEDYKIKKRRQLVECGVNINGIFKINNEKSNCIDANYHKGVDNHGQRTIVCGAIRGCNPENPTSRESGLNTVQMLELRQDEKTNTLTSVQKENVLVQAVDSHASKNGLECIAGIIKNKKWLEDGKNLQRNFSQGERIYSKNGKSPTLSANSGGTAGAGSALILTENTTTRHSEKCEVRRIANRKKLDDKGNSLLASTWKGEAANGCTIINDTIAWRKLTVRECARLQTVPENVIDVMLNCGVSNSQLYKMLGNGWTIKVISHIFSFIPGVNKIENS